MLSGQVCKRYLEDKFHRHRAKLFIKNTEFAEISKESRRALADEVGIHVDALPVILAWVIAAGVALCLTMIPNPARRTDAGV